MSYSSFNPLLFFLLICLVNPILLLVHVINIFQIKKYVNVHVYLVTEQLHARITWLSIHFVGIKRYLNNLYCVVTYSILVY